MVAELPWVGSMISNGATLRRSRRQAAWPLSDRSGDVCRRAQGDGLAPLAVVKRATDRASRLPPPGTWRHWRAIVSPAGKTGPIPHDPAGRKRAMTAKRGIFGAAVVLAIFGLVGSHAAAQKPGGILRQYIIDSPASMSIHEETTVVAERPMMGMMNNLVIFDQHVAQ